MQLPATDWQEKIGSDEEARFEAHARTLVAIQKRKSQEFGPGRALHRKQLLALDARLDVKEDLPDYARHGLFAKGGSYGCLVRLSNGAMDVKADSAPDIRGFAIKVGGISGPSALGEGNTFCQDFLLINHDVFSSPGVEPFMGVVKAAAGGNMALVSHMFSTHGFFGGLGQLKKAAAMFSKPFTGFATEKFSTVLPICCGPYAMRLRITPASIERNRKASADWAADMRARLERGALVYPLDLQFYVSETATPIEDASVSWSEKESPWIPAGTLTLPQQSFGDDAAQERESRAETSHFDPWNALMVHRPLGEIMRARKVAYYASQQARAKPVS